MPSLPVVEDLKGLEDGVGELQACPPAPSVEQLDLHAGPERLDDGVMNLTGYCAGSGVTR